VAGMRRTAVAVLLAGAVLLITAGSAVAVTETATRGAVGATFSFTSRTDSDGLMVFGNEHLRITRAGTLVYDQPVGAKPCSTQFPCTPVDGFVNGHVDKKSVQVLPLSGSEPAVVLDLYTGGAHCCSVAKVYAYDAGANTYQVTTHDFFDPGYELRPIGRRGRYQFVSADDRFANAFTSFAASGFPIQIWSFGVNGFIDVTRTHRKLIIKDAAKWLRAFKHHLRDGEGVLAAWAADEERLGHSGLVNRTLSRQLAAGHLKSNGVANGKAFVRALKKLLHKLGYTH
jgi:hypothetical protein